jgi:hypothetical protein
LASALNDLKVARMREVGAELAKRMAAGFVYRLNAYQLDDDSQARITALAFKAQRMVDARPGTTWDANFVFLAADNTAVSFTAANFLPFADAASNVVIARRIKARQLKDTILAAADAAALAAIDITAGWP